MGIGAVFVTVIFATDTTLRNPHGRVEQVGTDPATYRFPPFSRPTVAPGTATLAPAVPVVMSRAVTVAPVPPHSAPQLNTYAVLSSLLKTADTGRSKPLAVVTAL